MEMNYKVYVHINKVNGKRYYGITRTEVEERWKNGKGYKRHEYFTRAIEKYGWNEGFEHIVIARGLTEEEAKWLEIELIREWDTRNKDKGYNITKGGDDNPMNNEEVRKKASESHKGMTLSEETKKKMSKVRKGKQTGKNNPRATKVYCVELDMYFDTVRQGAKFVGCSDRTISAVLTGKNKTAKGYHWIYAEDVNNMAVYIIELDKYFDSINKCAEFLKCSRRIVVNVLYHRLNKYKGYHIIYAEDVEIENNKVS